MYATRISKKWAKMVPRGPQNPEVGPKRSKNSSKIKPEWVRIGFQSHLGIKKQNVRKHTISKWAYAQSAALGSFVTARCCKAGMYVKFFPPNCAGTRSHPTCEKACCARRFCEALQQKNIARNLFAGFVLAVCLRAYAQFSIDFRFHIFW